MKAAYLAYDRNSLMSLSVLSNYFEQVDFYLVDKDRQPESTPFSDVSLMVEHVMIPADSAGSVNLGLRTPTHLKLLKSVQDELQFYREQLGVNFRKNAVAQVDTEVQKNCRSEISSLDVIKDVVFNPKSHDIYIEKEKAGVTSYQYLLVEDHQIIAESCGRFAKNIFKTSPAHSHIWFAAEFDYELQKPRNGSLGRKEFVLVQDRQNKSVLDNWYFIRTSDNKIVIHQWVPFNQFRNSDFQKFIIERIRKVLKEKLDVLHLTQFNQFYVDSTSGFALRTSNFPLPISNLKHSKVSSGLPSFHFWSRERINRCLYTQLDPKIKHLNKLRLAQQQQQNLRGP